MKNLTAKSAKGAKKRDVLLYIGMITLILFTSACSRPPDVADVPPLEVEATAVPSPTPPATHTPIPPAAATPPTFTPQPTAAPTDTPTPTPLLLAAPPEWTDTAETAVRTENLAWQTLSHDNPAQALADGMVQAALVNNADGRPVAREPIVLAVPFTTDWENTDRVTAQGILDNGHSLAVVMSWSEMTPNRKALRIDGRHPADADYPFHDAWSLLTAADLDETAVAPLHAALQTNWPASPVIHLAAVGDIMLDRSLGFHLSEGKLDYPFYFVADALRAADITVGNLESALGDTGEPAPKSYTFQAPPEAALALGRAGFDVVSLANNHGMDYGPESLLQGLDLLRAQSIGAVGAGPDAAAAHTPYITETHGLTLAFLGYVNVPVEARSAFDTAVWTAAPDTPGLAWADPAQIQEDVTAVRPQVDLVIVILHSGYEYIEPPSPEQTAAAQAAIDAGADLVLGHHAHILQGIQFYKDGVIIYGLGNFAFEIDGDPSTGILNVWLDQNGVRQLELIPALIQFGGQPRLAEPWEAYPIRQTLYRLTRSFPHHQQP